MNKRFFIGLGIVLGSFILFQFTKQTTVKKDEDSKKVAATTVTESKVRAKTPWSPKGNQVSKEYSTKNISNQKKQSTSEIESDSIAIKVEKNSDPKVFKSLKALHLAHIRTSQELGKTEKIDQNGDLLRSTLYKVQNNKHSHYIIKDRIEPSTKKAKTSYVYVANEFVVDFHNKLSKADLHDFQKKHHLHHAKKLGFRNSYKFSFNDVGLKKYEAIEVAMQSDPMIRENEGNSLVYSSKVPNDTLYNTLWGLSNSGTDPINNNVFVEDTDIQADSAWEDMTDCSNTVVAVMDTGADMNHPDLKDNLLPDLARDFTGSPSGANDAQGHGTHVAGTIGAVGNNSMGVTGVCWKAKIIPVKVLGDDGTGTLDGILNGYQYIATTDAKVINMSLGGAPPSQMELDAIVANTSQGKLFVIAAGNDNNDNDGADPAYPASYQDANIISVAATHGGGDLAVFSNYGANSVDIAAPGQDIQSTIPTALSQDPNNPYASLSGTSMACPHVAGAVTLFWSYAPELNAQQVKAALLDSSITGSFSKAVADSRSMDLKAFLDEVKAKADIQLEAGTITVSDSTQYSINLSSDESYASITSIDVMIGDEVLGSASSAVENLTIQLPLGMSNAEVYTRVTDSAGRQYISAGVTLDIDLNKVISFVEVDRLALSGSDACTVSKVVEGSEEKLYEANVENDKKCEKLCDVVGPLLYSSKGEIKCSIGSEVIYDGKGE